MLHLIVFGIVSIARFRARMNPWDAWGTKELYGRTRGWQFVIEASKFPSCSGRFRVGRYVPYGISSPSFFKLEPLPDMSSYDMPLREASEFQLASMSELRLYEDICCRRSKYRSKK